MINQMATKQEQIIINQMTKLELLYRRPQIAITKVHGTMSMDEVSYAWTSKSAEKRYKELKVDLDRMVDVRHTADSVPKQNFTNPA